MKIAIIGAGNVGGALARNFASKGHQILLGLKDPQDPKNKEDWPGEAYHFLSPAEAAQQADIGIMALPVPAIVPVLETLGDLSGKVFIDATNSVFGKPEPYRTGYEALQEINKADAIKCFNTTGFENMQDPTYGGTAIDMFIAGGSASAKEQATALSKEAGFAAVYDFGGEDKVDLIEQFAFSWINLAIMQKEGRDIAFKVLHR